MDIQSHRALAGTTLAGTGNVLGLVLLLDKALFVQLQPLLLGHDPGQIHRETVGIVQTPSIGTTDGVRLDFLGFRSVTLK